MAGNALSHFLFPWTPFPFGGGYALKKGKRVKRMGQALLNILSWRIKNAIAIQRRHIPRRDPGIDIAIGTARDRDCKQVDDRVAEESREPDRAGCIRGRIPVSTAAGAGCNSKGQQSEQYRAGRGCRHVRAEPGAAGRVEDFFAKAGRPPRVP